MRSKKANVIPTQLGIIDVGIANLGSILRILSEEAEKVHLVTEPRHLSGLDRVVLPGVGAFPAAMRKLRDCQLDKALLEFVVDEAKPILGICLGMQLLAEAGEEFEETAGLGLVKGRVRRLSSKENHRIPHVGWNSLDITKESLLLKDIPEGSDFYFVHSFVFDPSDACDVVATSTHGEAFCSVVSKKNVVGVQFHPEKSSGNGRQLLRNFCEYV